MVASKAKGLPKSRICGCRSDEDKVGRRREIRKKEFKLKVGHTETM